jgi:hypothetical protein
MPTAITTSSAGSLQAVLQPHGGDAATLAGDQHLGLLAEQELQAALFERSLQHPAGGLVELAFEQPVGEMDHRHVHAAQPEAVRRLESEQAATDDHRMAVALRGIDHRVGIGDVAVGDHPRQVVAGNGQHEGIRTGRQQQAVVVGAGAIVGDHPPPQAVDPLDLLP